MLLVEIGRTWRHLAHNLLGLEVERLLRRLKHQVLVCWRIVCPHCRLYRLCVISLRSLVLVLECLRTGYRLTLFVRLYERGFRLVKAILRLESKLRLETLWVYRKDALILLMHLLLVRWKVSLATWADQAFVFAVAKLLGEVKLLRLLQITGFIFICCTDQSLFSRWVWLKLGVERLGRLTSRLEVLFILSKRAILGPSLQI